MARPLRSYSYDEYLHALEASHIKLEFIEGETWLQVKAAVCGAAPNFMARDEKWLARTLVQQLVRA
jgi:hypothetical protein